MNCPNCQSKYNNCDNLPKILVKCGHTFCIKCLENIKEIKDNETDIYLNCPTCNEGTIISDLNSLPKNIALLENNLNKVSTNDTVTQSNQNKALCKVHSKDIEAFCETDRTMLCVSCIIENSHKNHDLSSIEKAAQKERASFEKGFTNALLMENELNLTLQHIEEIKNKLILNSESNIQSIEHFYNGIREILSERESVLKSKIESVLDNEIDIFQVYIDKINEQIDLIKKMKEEKDNFDYLNEFEVLKKSKENNENLKNILNKPPKINREVIFYELKRDEEINQIKKILSTKISTSNNEDSQNTSTNLSNLSSIINTSGCQSNNNILTKKGSVNNNYLSNEIKKLEKKSKQMVETKSNTLVNPKNNLNVARDNLKAKKNQTLTNSLQHSSQGSKVSPTSKNNQNNNQNAIIQMNNNSGGNLNKIRPPNIEKSYNQKRNKTPGKFDINESFPNNKNETIANTTNLGSNTSNDQYNQEKIESESFNFVGKTSEKEPPKGNKQKTLALFPALKIKISNSKIPQMNKSEIVITDMEAYKQGEISPSFRREEEKQSSQQKPFHELNELSTIKNNRIVGDDTLILDKSTQKNPRDNLLDSTININVTNTSQLMYTTQSISTDLASLYKTFTYSLLILGGKPDGTVRKFELESKVWKEIKNVSIDRCDFCAIMYKEKKILLIGGRINETIVDSIDLLNMDELAVKKLDIKLKVPRANFGAVYLNSKLFVAGGNSGRETLSSFDYFDKKTKTWYDLQRLNMKRKEFCMIVGSDSTLYALGGSDEKDSVLKSVERYEIEKNVWKKMEEMNQTRKNFSALAMPDGIYVFGGNDGCQYLKSVEKYDYFNKKWKYLQDMNFPRSHFSCVSSNDCRYIYALGGYDGKPLNSMERYDVTMNKWEVMNKMNNFKYKHQAVYLCE